MFVSSYSTYVNTNVLDRTQKERVQSSRENSTTFQTKLNSQTGVDENALSSAKVQLPINYVSNYKVLNNQQKLQEETTNNQQSTKFTKISNQNSAKSAYSENSTLFPSLRKPKTTLDQTPSIDTSLPVKEQEAQELVLKHKMINTYIANENYYKITA